MENRNMENRNKLGHRSKVAWANEPNQEHLLLQSTLLFGYRVFFGVYLDPLILQLYNMRSFLTLLGVIRFRRDMWRSDRASRMSVGLVNHPAKQ